LILISALLPAHAAASPDVRYDLMGEDRYRIVATATVSTVSYSGIERLSVSRDGKGLRFDARAKYVRQSTGWRGNENARFVGELFPDGTFESRLDNDPDFLTLLNQPFAVQLDKPTLGDLRALQGAVPFVGGSPIAGGTQLHGFLRHGNDGLIAGMPTVAVHFTATGPMSGTLPGSTQTVLGGTMALDGTAYYSTEAGLLLALRATLTIDARVHQAHANASVPVQIVYRRWIRVSQPQPDLQQALSTRQ
jgi:hypothetical protein